MNEIVIRADVLRDALTGALVGVSIDKHLPVFNCVKITGTPSGVEFVGTDRYMISRGIVAGEHLQGQWADFQALLTADSVKAFISELKTVLKQNKNLGVKLVSDGGQVHLVTGLSTISADSLTNSLDFPRLDYILDTARAHQELDTIGINPDNFAKLCKIPAVKNSHVKLEFSGATKPITATIEHATIEWLVLIMPVRLP